ncbi:MAG: hypothetical protein JJE35_12770 [Thermoleophilia bacterium]|nr:hypothetical protein [Thermoleophilia bacterium]
MKTARLGSLLVAGSLAGLWAAGALALDWPDDTIVILGAVTLLAAIACGYYAGRHARQAGRSRARIGWRGMSRRSRVDVTAGICAFVVFVGAATALMLQPLPSASTELETELEKTTVTTEVGSVEPAKPGEPIATTGDKEVVEEERKVDPSDDSLLGRTLDNDASIALFRLGVALFAAFITGFAVQRIGLGKYGIKFGPLDLAEITTAPVENHLKGSEKLKERLAAVTEKNEGRESVALASGSPAAALITLSSEVEAALRDKARPIPTIDATSAPLPMVIETFGQAYGLDENGRAVLHDVVELGDRAEKGAEIGEGVGRWLVGEGQYLPAAIESLEPPKP